MLTSRRRWRTGGWRSNSSHSVEKRREFWAKRASEGQSLKHSGLMCCQTAIAVSTRLVELGRRCLKDERVLRRVGGRGTNWPVAPAIFTTTTTHLPRQDLEHTDLVRELLPDYTSLIVQHLNSHRSLPIDLPASETPQAGSSSLEKGDFANASPPLQLWYLRECSEAQDHFGIVLEHVIIVSGFETRASSFPISLPILLSNAKPNFQPMRWLHLRCHFKTWRHLNFLLNEIDSLLDLLPSIFLSFLSFFLLFSSQAPRSGTRCTTDLSPGPRQHRPLNLTARSPSHGFGARRPV